MGKKIDILLGILTCRRPKLLTELLDSIVVQTVFDLDVKIEIVLVDNDTEMRGLPVFEAFKDKIPCNFTYLVEKKRGIPFARNRVIEYATRHNYKYIAFIDDDETASIHWLETLYTVIKETGVDAVQGKVISLLPEGKLPGWARHAKRKEHNKEEGAPRSGLSTNNVIFSTSLVLEKGLRFDEKFALTGGSDIDFFRKSARLGSKHIWTNRAIVYEKIPVSRISLKWQFLRLFRTGATGTFMTIKHISLLYALVRYIPKIVIRLFFGPIIFITAGLFSSRVRLLSVHLIGSGLGHLLGFFGILGEEYSTIHGD